MIVRKKTLQIIGAFATVGLGITVYVIWDQRKKDKLAALLWEELSKVLNPSTLGLSGEIAFDVNYADEISRKVKNVVLMKGDSAANLAKTIRSSLGIILHDTDKINGVFRGLKDKVQVSQVAKAYAAGKVNLIDELRNKLRADQLVPILSIVKSLPPYRVVN
jgi:hypothetical protein